MRNHRAKSSSIPLVLTALLAGTSACAGAAPLEPAPPVPDAAPSLSSKVAPSAATPSGPPTAEEARQFLNSVDLELRKLWVRGARASWVNQNFITGDTDKLAAAADEATMEYLNRTIKAATRFDGLKLPPEDARKLYLLKFAGTLPAPSDATERAELAETAVQMQSTYGKGKYCPPRLKGKCQTLGELSNILADNRNYDELLEAWTGWHSVAPPIKKLFTRYAELGNKGAKEIGFSDLGALWRSGYDMPPDKFAAETERLWSAVKPLYDDLHCYVRAKLRKQYGKEKIGDKAPIPAHLLGNMWAQDWTALYPILEPYAGQASLDVTKALKAKKYDETAMVKSGEGFFTSLGLEPLPKTFWERSLFKKPQDRDVVCHASAWDVTYDGDIRIKMCIEIKEEDFVTIHHELGHNYYYMYYHKLPMLFQAGANDGFHEGIGDTLALSVTPEYLKKIGLFATVPNNPKAETNFLLKQALEKIAFLPFGKLIDQWRWEVLSGKTPESAYNKAWWDLKVKYQGVASPVPRSEADFDPGAKFHIPSGTPYVRYFLARFYQFQFHRALCKAAGHTGPLHTCSIHGSKAAGDKLKNMLAMGASRPWKEALAALSGETEIDPGALLQYFEPLRGWLKEENKGETCGW